MCFGFTPEAKMVVHSFEWSCSPNADPNFFFFTSLIICRQSMCSSVTSHHVSLTHTMYLAKEIIIGTILENIGRMQPLRTSWDTAACSMWHHTGNRLFSTGLPYPFDICSIERKSNRENVNHKLNTKQGQQQKGYYGLYVRRFCAALEWQHVGFVVSCFARHRPSSLLPFYSGMCEHADQGFFSQVVWAANKGISNVHR